MLYPARYGVASYESTLGVHDPFLVRTPNEVETNRYYAAFGKEIGSGVT